MLLEEVETYRFLYNCRTPVRHLISALLYNTVYPGSENRDHWVDSGLQWLRLIRCRTFRPRFWPQNFFNLTFWNKISSRFLTHRLSVCRRNILITLVTISLKTYGILTPEAATVCCGRRPQTSWVIGEPIRGRRSPQMLVAEGHKDLWVTSPG